MFNRNSRSRDGKFNGRGYRRAYFIGGVLEICFVDDRADARACFTAIIYSSNVMYVAKWWDHRPARLRPAHPTWSLRGLGAVTPCRKHSLPELESTSGTCSGSTDIQNIETRVLSSTGRLASAVAGRFSPASCHGLRPRPLG